LRIVYAVDNGVDVINLSIQGGNAPTILQEAVEYAYANDVFMAVAMGNSNTDTPSYPAIYPEVIAVGATDCDDTRVDATITEWGSNYGNNIDIVAPGNWILGLRYDTNEYGTWFGGTSMAAPMVAGAASLLLSIRPDLTTEQLRNILVNTAEDQVGNPAEDTPGYDIYYGAGRMNVEAAIASVINCDETEEGAPCDDNNPCTVNDVLDPGCICVGDACPDVDDSLIGTPCDDGNVCTEGETYNGNCDCTGGVIQDADNDGVCDAEDVCPNIDDNLIGMPCDDGIDCTINDVYDNNCKVRLATTATPVQKGRLMTETVTVRAVLFKTPIMTVYVMLKMLVRMETMLLI